MSSNLTASAIYLMKSSTYGCFFVSPIIRPIKAETLVAPGGPQTATAAAGGLRFDRGVGAGIGDNPSYVSRVMRLACLAPDITEAILEGQDPAHLTAKELLAPLPLDWFGQRAHFKLG